MTITLLSPHSGAVAVAPKLRLPDRVARSHRVDHVPAGITVDRKRPRHDRRDARVLSRTFLRPCMVTGGWCYNGGTRARDAFRSQVYGPPPIAKMPARVRCRRHHGPEINARVLLAAASRLRCRGGAVPLSVLPLGHGDSRRSVIDGNGWRLRRSRAARAAVPRFLASARLRTARFATASTAAFTTRLRPGKASTS